MLAPLADTALAILLSWLILAVAARLFALFPRVRNLRMRRKAGLALRIVGWVLVALTPIITVLFTAFASDALVVWLAVSGPLAVAAVLTLGPGIATRSRLDAKVIQSDGSTNGAWAIDALLQVQNVNFDDPRKRVERPASPDLTDFITIADRSGSGIASVIAWLVQVLFNGAPWMLQVTVLDERSAIAALRRNGLSLGEVELRLEWPSDGSDQHRKLLALAAAFTAMTMADRYPDVRGFYRAKNWMSVGYLGLAHLSEGAERAHYLGRAIELEPRSLLAEYAKVFDGVREAHDRESLETLMDRLEPVANQCAWVRGQAPVFDAVPRDWHEHSKPVRQGDSGPMVWSKPPNGRRPLRESEREPIDMLLRALMLYTFAARNWAALVELDCEATSDVDSRRARIRLSVEQLVDALGAESKIRMKRSWIEHVGSLNDRLRRRSELDRQRRDAEYQRKKDPSGVLIRMRARTALCYLIFTDCKDAAELVALADPGATSTSGRRPRSAGVDTRSNLVRAWLTEMKGSAEIEIRYSYACYLARRACREDDTERRADLVHQATRRVQAAQLVDYYKVEAPLDPELKLLGYEASMRELVLASLESPWEIDRFARVHTALVNHGIIDPTGIAEDDDLSGLIESTALNLDEFRLLLDASRILCAIQSTDEGGLHTAQRLRAAQYVIDARKFSARALRATFESGFEALVAELAAAVFWVPSSEELEQVERFLVGVIGRVAAEASEPYDLSAGAAR